MVVNKLSDIVKPNANFKNAINLYLDINKRDKVESYIPTKSSLNILNRYLKAVYDKKSQSTILIGSYGKGKSHLILVLLAILSMQRNEENDKSDYFKIIGGKIFIDGVIDNSTAYLTSPYIDASYENKINFGYNIWGKYKSELIYAIKVLNENKLQAHFHVIGDNAVKFVLDIIEKMPKYYRNMHRNVLTHLQIVRRRDLKRISKLKLIASLQTYWDVKEPNYFEESEYKRWGERAEYEYPLKSLYDEGVLISGASDYPITEINPILAIQIGATRNICNDEEYECEQITSIDDEKYLLNGNERLSVY